MTSERKVLVTGGAGFLGNHLCRALVAQGHQVTCLDDLSTGREENLITLLDRPGFRLVTRNVTDPIEGNFDEIYNLACPASPVKYRADPIRTIRTSVDGTMSVLDAARRTGAKVVQASTSEIYGDPTRHPQRESDASSSDPASPRACYEEGKRMAEVLCHEFRRLYKVEVKIVRIFNTYGPGLRRDDGRAVSNFVSRALTGDPLTVYGSGKQTRSFCYVDDMIDALQSVMAAEVGPRPVNAGNPHEVTVRSLAEKVIQLTGSSSKLLYDDPISDDPKRRCPDINQITTLTGWTPNICLDDGLQRTIADFRQRSTV